MLVLVGLLSCTPAGSDVPLATLQGTWSWTVSFDDAARDAGKRDCRYERFYTGEEDRSVPWLCPECDIIYRSTVGMSEEGEACYSDAFGAPPDPVEWLGFGEDADGNDLWYRGSENSLLAARGVASIIGDRATVSYASEWADVETVSGESADRGQYKLDIDGEATLGQGAGDPWHGLLPPESYTCGWADRSPPAYDGPWILEDGRLLPDGAFLDRCDEALRLHDLVGTWLVVNVTAMDCAECQTMALETGAFLETATQPVSVVTLLTKSLASPFLATRRSDIDAWADAFDLSSPVVRDRGWGFWLGYERFDSRFNYPMTVVVGPDGRVRDMWIGYLGWDRVRAVIDAG